MTAVAPPSPSFPTSGVLRANRVAVVMLAIAFGIAACQGSGASPSSSSPDVSTGPTSSVAIGPAASVSPEATAGDSRAAGAQIVIKDPDLAMTLPGEWTEYPMSIYRSLIASIVKESSPAVQAAYAKHLTDIDGGAVRMMAGGPAGLAPVTGSMILQIDSGDASLETAVARIGLIEMGFVQEPATVNQRPVTLAIGKAIRRVETHAVPPDTAIATIPSRTVEYIALLADGRTLWILASGPEASLTFEALIDASVTTIHVR